MPTLDKKKQNGDADQIAALKTKRERIRHDESRTLKGTLETSIDAAGYNVERYDGDDGSNALVIRPKYQAGYLPNLTIYFSNDRQNVVSLWVSDATGSNILHD